MSDHQPIRSATERNTEAARRRQTGVLVDVGRAAITAYVEHVQREAARTLAILDRVQQWADDGGSVPAFLTRYREVCRLTYDHPSDAPWTAQNAAAAAELGQFPSSVPICEAALHACLAHASGSSPFPMDFTLRSIRDAIAETSECAPAADEMTAAYESALGAA